jgi:protein SCO1
MKTIAKNMRFVWCCVYVVLSMGLASCEKTQHFNGQNITGAPYAQAFTLTDMYGKQVNLSDFKGKVVVLFFGYTQCPSICPTTMAEMAMVKKNLGAQADKLQVLFITVDPTRDTPEILTAYMHAFDPTFLALRPTPDEVDPLTINFRIYYNKVPNGSNPNDYLIDHTATCYVYDTHGKLRLIEPFNAQPDLVTQDIKALLKTTP